MSCKQLALAALLLALAQGAAAAPPVAANGMPVSSLVISEVLPPVPPEQQALMSIPLARGAPAVVLLNAQQTQWRERLSRQRIFRRVKILTEAGVHSHGNFEMFWWGDAKLATVSARTVLPDGSIVDAKDTVHVETSTNPDSTLVTIAFPRVEVGAILDLLVERRDEYFYPEEWVIQEDIPVLESRFLVTPPAGLRFRPVFMRVVEEKAERTEFELDNERMYAWIFHDSPALPEVPNRPPARDIAARLVFVSDGYRYGKIPYGAGWTEVIEIYRKEYEEWIHGKHAQVDALARKVAGTAGSARDKAEALRIALRDRIAVASLAAWMLAKSPDDALASGKGNSADVALLEIAGLRALGVDAHAAGVRRRSSGAAPSGSPAPNLLNDLLVVVPSGLGSRDLVFSPVVDQPVDLPDPDRVGVQAVSYRKSGTELRWIADVDPAENGITRDAALVLGANGGLSGKVTCSPRGFEAARWRRELATRTEDQRKDWIDEQLDDHLSSLRVGGVQVSNLEDVTKPLVVEATISADAAATRAGGRLLVNPRLFARIGAADWAAEQRDVDVDLGRPREDLDTLRLELPAGEPSVPAAPREFEAGPVGTHACDCLVEGTTLKCTRRLRLEKTQVPAASYPSLRDWFRRAADADDQVVVVTMAQP